MDLQGKFTNADSVNFPNVRFDITNGSVAISKAKVTLQSANLTKEYDGTALTNKKGDEEQTPLAVESGWAEVKAPLTPSPVLRRWWAAAPTRSITR